MSHRAYIHLAGEAELRWMGETSTQFLATGDDTGGEFALVDERAERGVGPPLHVHDDVESFYVVEGEVTFFLGDQPGVRAGAGSFAHVPAGAVHGFRVESDTGRYLILTTPRHAEFYRAITVPTPSGAVEGAVIQAACQEYGVEFVGPLPENS